MVQGGTRYICEKAVSRTFLADAIYAWPYESIWRGRVDSPHSQSYQGIWGYYYSSTSDKWGGGIEVSILSQLYKIEICIVDIESCRIDRFGEDQNYPKRILLIYDGIHYDPLAQECPNRNCLVTVFSSNNDSILFEAQQLASKARAEWAFTDLSSFTLLCRQCDAPLIGQEAAQKHAQLTGHTQFREILH
ncbi:unnamed protein product [Schistosoma margrebowiei]|uniref:Ubiquitin thioesterase OTU n=1 Tax=Schistosoma margrebowiei TaxID=48269 RepID=A0A3P7UEN2_9TREM|nr:unnamed protein product [Schistosoma margrebowiei]